MKTTMRIFALIALMLLLAGCVTKIGGTAQISGGEKTTTEAQPTATTEVAETTAATTEPTPTETVKPCEHEWELDELEKKQKESLPLQISHLIPSQNL